MSEPNETTPLDYAHRATLRVGDAEVVVYAFKDAGMEPMAPRHTWIRWDARGMSLVLHAPHAVMRELGQALIAAADAAPGGRSLSADLARKVCDPATHPETGEVSCVLARGHSGMHVPGVV